MAVREIKNPTPPGPNQVKSVNRAKEVSQKNYKDRGTNREMTAIPGLAGENYSIDVKDLDTAIIHHIRNVMKLKVKDGGEMIDVPLIYGNEERWHNVRKRGAIRDKQGSLLLPLMMVRRTSIDKNTLSGQSFGWDLKGERIQVVRNNRFSKDNQYSNFAVQQGIKEVKEAVVTGMPHYLDTNYEFIIWTHYVTQMNSLVEEFINQSQTYWGEEGSYKFLCSVDNISDASEVTQGTERIVKTSFNIKLSGYILPEVVSNVIKKKVINAQRIYTPSAVVFEEKLMV